MQKGDQFSGKPFSKAVAIENDRSDGPVIVAKGDGFNAEKILEIAFAEGVKVRQDKSLVEMLDAYDVESPIPLEALHAVSLILERVYQEERRLSATAGQSSESDTGEEEAPYD